MLHDCRQNVSSGIASPDLVFAVFHCVSRWQDQTHYEIFFQRYQDTPLIGVINCPDSCGPCTLLQKYIWNFITIPFSEDDILLAIEQFMCLNPENLTTPMKSGVKEEVGFDLLKGNSNRLLYVKEKLSQAAQYNVTVLLCGETGTGKELGAKIIHFLSPRSGEPFIAVNCGAIPPNLFENELFGHRKGAYTSASMTEQGLVHAADGGTLFLDEVESLVESTQIKLLRLLEQRKYKPLGQSREEIADVRFIAAAKENLWELVQQGQFREDLFYRLNVVRIDLPPLRARREDIPELARYFVQRYSELYDIPIQGIKPVALFCLMQKEWHGNVRELENVIQSAVVTNSTGWIDIEDLNLSTPDGNRHSSDGSSFQDAKQRVIEEFEQNYLKDIMITCKGNISQAARVANTDRRALYRLLNKYQIKPVEFRG
ncbi:MAG TPA: sigma-54 dependent transcriptional regulator [bacterium]|nr:sigma-54 dependent transcriptional regulator [bacterium]